MTKYYYKLVNLRRRGNQVHSIIIDGEESAEDDKIREHIVQFYEKLFHEDGSQRPEMDGMFFNSISQEQQQ
ncbi:hypothetical protein FRX31_024150, partial [Thalictrum thalictroides]